MAVSCSRAVPFSGELYAVHGERRRPRLLIDPEGATADREVQELVGRIEGLVLSDQQKRSAADRSEISDHFLQPFPKVRKGMGSLSSDSEDVDLPKKRPKKRSAADRSEISDHFLQPFPKVRKGMGSLSSDSEDVDLPKKRPKHSGEMVSLGSDPIYEEPSSCLLVRESSSSPSFGGPEPHRLYHWNVYRWTDPRYDVFTEDPFYTSKKLSLDARGLIWISHTLGRALFPVVIQQGKRFDEVEPCTGRSASRYTMLGTIEDDDGFLEKGVFTVVVGADDIIYHAFFTQKKVDDLVAEYLRKGFFESDAPEGLVRGADAQTLPDDGSRVISVEDGLVRVYDKIHALFLTVSVLRT